jgi:hypothetical protein
MKRINQSATPTRRTRTARAAVPATVPATAAIVPATVPAIAAIVPATADHDLLVSRQFQCLSVDES